jgi:hypothetical protein
VRSASSSCLAISTIATISAASSMPTGNCFERLGAFPNRNAAWDEFTLLPRRKTRAFLEIRPTAGSPFHPATPRRNFLLRRSARLIQSVQGGFPCPRCRPNPQSGSSCLRLSPSPWPFHPWHTRQRPGRARPLPTLPSPSRPTKNTCGSKIRRPGRRSRRRRSGRKNSTPPAIEVPGLGRHCLRAESSAPFRRPIR